MIYKNLPSYFNPKFEVVSCYLENDGDILLLRRQDHKPEGNSWGLPAGKMDDGEDKVSAMVREIFEETGLLIDVKDLEYVDKIYVQYPEYHFIYHSFRLVLKSRPLIKISPNEHKEYVWLSPQAALELELIRDLDACIKDFYGV
mgnify:CR=1 FL=1